MLLAKFDAQKNIRLQYVSILLWHCNTSDQSVLPAKWGLFSEHKHKSNNCQNCIVLYHILHNYMHSRDQCFQVHYFVVKITLCNISDTSFLKSGLKLNYSREAWRAYHCNSVCTSGRYISGALQMRLLVQVPFVVWKDSCLIWHVAFWVGW